VPRGAAHCSTLLGLPPPPPAAAGLVAAGPSRSSLFLPAACRLLDQLPLPLAGPAAAATCWTCRRRRLLDQVQQPPLPMVHVAVDLRDLH